MSADGLAVGVLLVAVIALVAGVCGLAVVVRRRVGGRWSTLGWGGLAFAGAQVVRLPVLALAPTFVPFPEAVIVLAVVTSGLAEEPARWLVLRFLARRDRAWRDGVLFGVGHGGIEALLVVGVSFVGTLVLLVASDAILAEVEPDLAGAATAIRAQLDAARAAPFTPLLGLWERALAITFHIAASLLVLRSVRDRRPQLLLAAIALHIGFNGVGAVAVYAGLAPVLVEVLLSVLAIGLVALIARERRREQDAPSPLDGGPRPGSVPPAASAGTGGS